MRLTRFLLLGMLGLLALTTVARCQTNVRLRLLDAGSGKPITGISLSVFAWDENEGRHKPPPPGVLKIDKNSQVVKTDKEGAAVFRLYYEPALKTLYIFSPDLRGCSAHQFPIDEVLQMGIVASYHSGQPQGCVDLKGQAMAKPGEIVIFDKRMTVWDRMRQEIP